MVEERLGLPGVYIGTAGGEQKDRADGSGRGAKGHGSGGQEVGSSEWFDYPSHLTFSSPQAVRSTSLSETFSPTALSRRCRKTGIPSPCIPVYAGGAGGFQSARTASSRIWNTSTWMGRHVSTIFTLRGAASPLGCSSPYGSASWRGLGSRRGEASPNCHALKSPPGQVDSAQRMSISAKNSK